MITNKGKNVLSKFLISQAPAYASYISIGCGPRPLSTILNEPFLDYSDQQCMDFEMLRLPIISKGYIKDGVDEKIVFTAELPTDERYEISEVGVWSAGANPSAVGFDSKMLFTFSQNEGWEFVDTSASTQSQIDLVTTLDTNQNNIIATTKSAFHFTSTNLIFANANRVQRYERPRILNNSLALVGNISSLSYSGSQMVAGNGSDYIKLSGTSVRLNKNAPTDLLKIAFSVMNKDGDNAAISPDNVKLLVQFRSSANPTIYANMQIDVDNDSSSDSDDAIENDFTENRYVVVTKELQDLYTTAGFSWGIVDEVRIYATVREGSSPSSDYYVALDAIRFENVTTQNPLYGLTGYTVQKTEDGSTVIKNQNTKNYIEFRFAINVGVV